MQSTEDTESRQFNSQINELIKMLELRSRSDDELGLIDRLRKRISLSKTIDEHAIIKLAAPWFIKYSPNILEENAQQREKFFLEMDPRKVYITTYKTQPPAEDEFMFTLSDMIKTHYQKADAKLRIEIYNKVLSLHNGAIRFELIRNGAQNATKKIN